MKADVEPRPPAQASRRDIRMVLAGLLITMCLAALDQNIVTTALPQIVSDLGGLNHLSWVVTAFMLTTTMVTPIYGKLSDMYGRKPLFYIAIGLFLGSSVLCGLSQNMLQLIIFRGMQGAGAGGLITLSQTTSGDILSPRERPKYQGLFTGVWVVGSLAGPLLGGLITSAISWRWIFYVNLPIGVLALVLITLALKGRPPKVLHKLDYLGIALLMPAIGAFMLVLSWGGSTFPWASPQIIGLAIAGAVLMVALVWQERRAPEPIIALDLFQNRIFCVGATVTTINAMSLFGVGVFMSLYFQLVIGLPPYKAGLMLSPQILGMITASIIGGHIITHTGRYKIFLIAGCALVTAALTGLALSVAFAPSVIPILGCLFCVGVGMGLAMPNMTVAVQNAVTRDRLGAATSSIAFGRGLGASIGISLFGGLLASRLAIEMASRAMGGFDAKAILHSGIAEIARLPEIQRLAVVDSYHAAIVTVLSAGVVVASIGTALIFLMPEIPLGEVAKADEIKISE